MMLTRAWRAAESSSLVTVVVASANLELCKTVRALIDRTSDIQFSGAAQDITGMLSAVRQRQPRQLIVDLTLPQAGIRQLLVQLRKRELEGPRVLTIDNRFDEHQAVRMAKAGAYGYMAVEAIPTHLDTAIRKIAVGEAWFSRELAAKIVDEFHRLNRGRAREG